MDSLDYHKYNGKMTTTPQYPRVQTLEEGIHVYDEACEMFNDVDVHDALKANYSDVCTFMDVVINRVIDWLGSSETYKTRDAWLADRFKGWREQETKYAGEGGGNKPVDEAEFLFGLSHLCNVLQHWMHEGELQPDPWWADGPFLREEVEEDEDEDETE